MTAFGFLVAFTTALVILLGGVALVAFVAGRHDNSPQQP